MHELKLFILRLLAAAILVAFCLSVSRAADTQSQSNLSKRFAASSHAPEEILASPVQKHAAKRKQ